MYRCVTTHVRPPERAQPSLRRLIAPGTATAFVLSGTVRIARCFGVVPPVHAREPHPWQAAKSSKLELMPCQRHLRDGKTPPLDKVLPDPTAPQSCTCRALGPAARSAALTAALTHTGGAEFLLCDAAPARPLHSQHERDGARTHAMALLGMGDPHICEGCG